MKLKTIILSLVCSVSIFAMETEEENTSISQHNLDVTCLDLSHDESLTDISFIRHFPNLVELNLENTRLGNNYKPITYLYHLQSLKLSRLGLTAISPLTRLTSLVELDLSHGGMRRISPLLKLPNLEKLNLFACGGIRDIHLLGNITTLHHLHIGATFNNPKIKHFSLDFISSLFNLKSLNISFNNHIYSFDPIGSLINLEILDISACGMLPRLTLLSCEFISNLVNLKKIYIAYDEEKFFRKYNYLHFSIIGCSSPNPDI